MRKSGLTFAVVAALSVGALGAGTAAAPVLAASNTVSSNPSAGASASALTAKKKAAKRRALRKCGKKRSRKRRKACRRHVVRRFAPKKVKPDSPVKFPDPVAVIDVRDDYFSPDIINIKSGDSIKWVWDDLNHDPHNVSMTSGPDGVDRLDFRTATAPAVSYTWTRRFIVPGTYVLGCSLHFKMNMTVSVS